MSSDLVLAQYYLNPGYIYFPDTPTVISTVLGTSVSVCLHDLKTRRGAANHFLYPKLVNKKEPSSVYGDVATYTIVKFMVEKGSKIKHLVAYVVGGAYNPNEPQSLKVANENIQVARKVLKQWNIKIVSEDVGGQLGRKIVYNTFTNELAVLKVERLRQSDWYPYTNHR